MIRFSSGHLWNTSCDASTSRLIILLNQVIDVAVSLAKVADVDRNLGDEDTAIAGFQEAIKLLESLTVNSGEVGLEKRV